ESIHMDIMKNNTINKDNLIIQTTLIDMCGKMADVQKAEEIFSKISKKRNVISFGAMMKCYNANGLPKKTIELYEEMIRNDIQLSDGIYILVIDACSMCLSRQKGWLIHHEIMNKNKEMSNIIINNALINMYGKFGDIDNARRIFDSMNKHDIATYNTMINSYGFNGQGLDAIELYRRMREQERWTPDDSTFVVVLNACSHSGLVDAARRMFYLIDERYRNKFVTTAMVDALARSQHWDEAQSVIENYEKTNERNIVMRTTLLGAWRTYKEEKKAKEIYDKINEMKNISNNCRASVSVLLANTYASAG
ncbi:unnamed protein product, partial [Didymodactylos carnosus]